MPKAVRAELHERFARWLQAQAREGKGFGEHDEILGYHLEQAYRYRTELVPDDESARALAAEAGGVLATAARRALGREDMPAAVGLLERSLALLPDDDRTRGALLTELGGAAIRAGEWERARVQLEEAITSSVRVGDRQSELRATIELQLQRSYTEPAMATEENRRVAEAVIPELEAIDDHFGLAKAWWLLSEEHAIACRWAARAEALEKAILHARQSPDEAQLRGLLALYAQALYLGPTPVSKAVRACSDLARRRPGRADVQGRHRDDARRASCDGGSLLRSSRAVCRLSRGLRGVRPALPARGPLDRRRPDREPRWRPPPRRSVSYDSATPCSRRLASAGRGRHWRASLPTCSRRRSTRSRRSGSSTSREKPPLETDVVPQVLWRRALARTTSRRGDHQAAEELAREAVELAGKTDFLDLRAGTLVALGNVLAGCRQERGRPGKPRGGPRAVRPQGECRSACGSRRQPENLPRELPIRRQPSYDPESRGGEKWKGTGRGKYIGRASRRVSQEALTHRRGDQGRLREGHGLEVRGRADHARWAR